MTGSVSRVRTTPKARARWRNQQSAQNPVAKHNLPPGAVTVQRVRDGWLLVEVGRGRYVKRFNLRDSEAIELVMKLSEALPGGR